METVVRDNEKNIKTICNAINNMNEEEKWRFLGMCEGIAFKSENSNQEITENK